MNPLVYVVWPGSNHRSYQADQLMQAVVSRGGRSSILNLLDHTPQEIAQLEKPDGLVFNHYVSPTVNAQLDQLAAWGAPSINEVQAQRLTSNKFQCYTALQNAGVRVPLTVYRNSQISEVQARQIADELRGFPVVVKPEYGYSGRGVTLINSVQDLCEHVNTSVQNNQGVLIQRYIKFQKDVALSVLHIGSDVVCLLRVGSPFTEQAFKADVAPDRIRIPYTVTQGLYDLCESVKNAVGVDVHRTDILIGADGYYVIDVNTPGGFGGFDRIFGKRFATNIIDLLMEKIDARSS